MSDTSRRESEMMLARATEVARGGTHVRDLGSLYVRGELVCGDAVTIDVNVIIEGRVELGDGVSVGANCILRSATVGTETIVHPFTLIEETRIGSSCFIGPYARLRPGTDVGDEVSIGNFVEIKRSRIGDGGRINHHAFIGDALLAPRVTIGAGTITCNHDGKGAQQTVIESDAYVGSGCELVAPLRIGEGATIGAGSTITEDVPAGTLTIARARQTTVEGWRRPHEP